MKIKASVWFDGKIIQGVSDGNRKFCFDDIAFLEITDTSPGISASWHILKSGRYRFYVIFPSSVPPERVFIPSVWYRDNENGEGLFPRKSVAEQWSFLETRSSIPGFIAYVKRDGTIVTAIESASDKKYLSTVSWSDSGITYTIPGAERPYSYRGKSTLKDMSGEEEPSLLFSSGDVYKRKFKYIEYGITDEIEVFSSYIRRYADLSESNPPVSVNDYVSSKLTRLLNLVRRSEDGLAYLKMGEGNGNEQPVYEYTSGSFLVKSIEAASVFASLDDAVLPECPALTEAFNRIDSLFGKHNHPLPYLAELIGDYFLRAEVKPGIFMDCESLATGERGGYLGIGEHPEFAHLVNARCNGEAMAAYAKLCRYVRKDEYIALMKRVASFYIGHQLPSGSFGRWWSPDGECVNEKGTNGAYIGVFLIKLLAFSDGNEKEEIKKAVDRALAFYRDMALRGDFFGDTLDADSSDKEAAVSLLSFFLEYAENFSFDWKTRKASEYSASFILSWIFHENTFIDGNSPLGKTGFNCRGMSAVSIAHNHLDFYGMLIAKDFLRLSVLTGDDFYKKEAVLMINACRQLIDINPNRPLRGVYGFQPEQINHTSWDYFSREDGMNGTYDIDISWVNVLGLSAISEIKTRFPEVLR